MQTEDLSEVKSKPEYTTVTLNQCSGYHCFISEGEAPSAMLELFDECPQEKVIHLLAGSELASVSGIMKHFPLTGTLYLAGSEPFIWQVAEITRSLGLRLDQIRMFNPTTADRNLFCCHCYHVTEGALFSPYTCDGCGRLLAVTDHFAKAHSAYFCYQVNAEDNSDQPAAQEFCV